MKVENWDEERYGPLDLQAVRSLYQPAYRFRIQLSRYAPHTPFGTTGVASTYYVLSGHMQVSDGSRTCTIAANQYLFLPAGSYTITYPEAVEHVRVLELPERAWESEKKRHETKPDA